MDRIHTLPLLELKPTSQTCATLVGMSGCTIETRVRPTRFRRNASDDALDLRRAKNEGNVMANWVLNQQGKVIPRRSLRRLTKDERSQSNEVEAAKRAAFNADITSKLGDSIKLPTTPLPDMEEPDWNASRMETTK